MAEEYMFEKLKKITTNSVEYSSKTMELFRLRDELSAMMFQHVIDCGKLIGQMQQLIEELTELETAQLDQLRLLMQHDIERAESETT